MNTEKQEFLRNRLIPLLASINPDEKPRWGKMNVQQMIEHMSDSVKIASGKIPKKLLTPEDKLPRFYEFMMSDIPFKENTKNIEMAEEPEPLRWQNTTEALDEFRTELAYFFSHFDSNPDIRIMNPFFGNLNYAEWIQLFHKHSVHHLKQFGVEV